MPFADTFRNHIRNVLVRFFNRIKRDQGVTNNRVPNCTNLRAICKIDRSDRYRSVFDPVGVEILSSNFGASDPRKTKRLSDNKPDKNERKVIACGCSTENVSNRQDRSGMAKTGGGHPSQSMMAGPYPSKGSVPVLDTVICHFRSPRDTGVISPVPGNVFPITRRGFSVRQTQFVIRGSPEKSSSPNHRA